MKILITNLGTITDNIVSSSILKRLKKTSPFANITWCVKEEEYKQIFKYNKNINSVVSLIELSKMNDTFDLLINLDPYLPHYLCKNITIINTLGFGFNENIETFESIINRDEHNIYKNINLFQVYYKLMGIIWKGEGYDVGYYPKTRSKKNRVGVSIANANLRNYVLDKLNLQTEKISNIPYKKNIFKKMDEINKYSKIITDDALTLHLSLYLRKYVYFLQTTPQTTKIEFFGNGFLLKVPTKIYE